MQVAACGESGDWFEQLLENVSEMALCNHSQYSEEF